MWAKFNKAITSACIAANPTYGKHTSGYAVKYTWRISDLQPTVSLAKWTLHVLTSVKCYDLTSYCAVPTRILMYSCQTKCVSGEN